MFFIFLQNTIERVSTYVGFEFTIGFETQNIVVKSSTKFQQFIGH